MTDPAPGAWIPVGVAILRMAGFPFGWLDQVSDGAATAAAARCLALEDELAATWQWARHYQADVTGPDRAVLRRLRGGRLPRPADGPAQDGDLDQHARDAIRLRRALDVARHEFTDAYCRDTAAGSAAVVARFRADPALRDALLVSNEGVAQRLLSWLERHGDDQARWRSADRQSLTTLVRYLQRLCAKNETTSHFGPFAVGAFTAAVDGVSWRPGELVRTTWLSRWAATAVAEGLTEPAMVRPRRAPGAFLRDGLLRVVSLRHTSGSDVREAYRVGDPVVLDELDARLLVAADGRRTVDDLARLVDHRDIETVTARLKHLAELDAVRVGPELPYGTADALPAVRASAGGAADRLDPLAAALGDLAAVPYERRRPKLDETKAAFTRITGQAPRRDTSRQFYSDHGLFSETCLAPMTDVRFGRRIVEAITRDLAPLHDLLLLPARLRHVAEQRLLAGWFRDRLGKGPVSLGAYLAEFTADADRIEALVDEVAAGVERRMAEVEAALLPAVDTPGRHRHEVDLDAVLALTRTATPVPAMCSPDAMIAAASVEALERGDFTVVVGDAHATEDNLSHGIFSPHVQASSPRFAAEVVAGYRSLAEPDEIVADVTHQHRNATFVRCELPCPDLEAYDPAPGGDREVIKLHDLDVALDGETLRLRHRGSGRWIRLMAAPLAWCGLAANPMAVFAFPSRVAALTAARDRHHVPRLVMGRVVLQRETWRVPVADITATDPADAFLAVQRLRRRLDLPRDVFVKIPGQPKPVYCDLGSPLLVRSLVTMLLPEHGQVELSEMLPTPDDLWLDIDGQRRTSELRYTVFSGASRGRQGRFVGYV